MKSPKFSLRIVPVFVFGIVFALIPSILKRGSSSEYYINIIILVLLYSYLATAWNILGGYAGQHSLGNALYLGTGAYVSTILFTKWSISPWIGLLVAGLVSAIVGWLIGYLCFRYGLKGGYFALVTIALAEAAVYLVTNIRSLGGAMGLEITWLGNNPAMMQFDNKSGYYYIILGLTILLLIVVIWLDKSRFGYYLIAVRENDIAADALGVNPVKIKIQANIINAFITGIGGVFFAQYYTYIHPRLVFGEGPSVQILLFAIIGGLGTIWGPTLGAITLVPIAEITRAQLSGTFAGAPLLLYGLVLVLVMLFMPRGIMGLINDIRLNVLLKQKIHSKIQPTSEH
jgi:branched-chain amino acid transport system permease protein